MTPAGEGRLVVWAAQLLTRAPTPRVGDFAPERLTRSARYFSLVGLVIGLVCAGFWLVAGRLWPGFPAAIIAIAAGCLVTGALHEDGLADTADAFGGGHDRERRLAIMKDSRIGVFGALALILVTGLRITLLASLAPAAGAVALILANAGGRAATVVAMAALPYAGDPEAAKVTPTAGRVHWSEAAFAVAVGAVPALWLSPARAMLAIVLGALAATAMALTARRLIGGITGDVLGAIEQLAEAGLLLGVAASVTG